MQLYQKMENGMEMIKINSVKLRVIGYDIKTRVLRVELDGGTTITYFAVSESVWRHFKSSSNPWSFYRDNIEEEFSAQRICANSSNGGKNPLDDLFN